VVILPPLHVDAAEQHRAIVGVFRNPDSTADSLDAAAAAIDPHTTDTGLLIMAAAARRTAARMRQRPVRGSDQTCAS
jgi:hypothetical protein